MQKCTYYADISSITLINKNGTIIRLSNNYGDGSFDFFVFNNTKELKEFTENNGYRFVNEERLWLDQKGWKIMFDDTAKDYDHEGFELCTYTRIYSQGHTFFFVTEEY